MAYSIGFTVLPEISYRSGKEYILCQLNKKDTLEVFAVSGLGVYIARLFSTLRRVHLWFWRKCLNDPAEASSAGPHLIFFFKWVFGVDREILKRIH